MSSLYLYLVPAVVLSINLFVTNSILTFFSAFSILTLLLAIFKRGSSVNSSSLSSTQNGKSGDSIFESEAKIQVEREVGRLGTSSLDNKHRAAIWESFGKDIDSLLAKILLIVEERFQSYSAAIFLPNNSGSYSLKSSISRDETIKHDTIIVPGEGIVGGYLKEGIMETRFDLSSSQKLPYHTKTGIVKSAVIAPLKAITSSGFIIVDSLDEEKFSKEDLAWLTEIGEISGNLIFYAYLYQQHKLVHEEVTALSDVEKLFFACKSSEALLDEVAKVLTNIFNIDRLTVSLRQNDDDKARVERVFGEGCDKFIRLEFDLNDVTLSNVFYRNRGGFTRNFSSDHYEVRYIQNEPRDTQFRSFAALPLGIEERVRGVVLLESKRADNYSTKDMESLSRLIDAASIALEKIMVLELNRKQAIRDGLTGLYNHREFQTLLRQSMARSHRQTNVPNRTADSNSPELEKSPLSLVLCDIDFFKKLNDNYGHSFGDLVLKEVSATLEAGVRDGVDYACRYGGEEFTLVLNGTGEQGAIETANRIRKSIEALEFTSEKGELVKTTMSFGISVYDRDAKKQEELIVKADKALYRAKESGRNCVITYSGSN